MSNGILTVVAIATIALAEGPQCQPFSAGDGLKCNVLEAAIQVSADEARAVALAFALAAPPSYGFESPDDYTVSLWREEHYLMFRFTRKGGGFGGVVDVWVDGTSGRVTISDWYQ